MYTKKWTPYRFLLFLLLVNLSACTFQTEVLTPGPSLPDLVVSSINVGMVDANGRCLNGYSIQAVIFNQGTASADGVVAVESATSAGPIS